jgi:molybdopterin molybdotransferase
MITVEQADKILTQTLVRSPVIQLPLEAAAGAVLRDDIRCDRDIPPCDKILMDGIALNLSEWEKGVRQFIVDGVQAAGRPQRKLKAGRRCIEVMTGAVLPEGCDCVIPVERIKRDGKTVTVPRSLTLTSMQNVQPRGSDHKKGEVVLSAGILLSPPGMAVAAAVGKVRLRISRPPAVAIITTGDELVDVGKSVKPHQIRKSNSYALKAALAGHGYGRSKIFHIRDDKKQLFDKIETILREYDILVLSGGVSMGKFDFVPQVLKALGVKVLFHQVRQKPGKPFWFGRSSKGKIVFALPGNPVSTQVCFYRYVLPYLDRMLGRPQCGEQAVLAGAFTVKTDLTFFLPVRIDPKKVEKAEKAEHTVLPNPISHSGDFVGLSESDGFVELKAGKRRFSKGAIVPFYRW